MTESTVAPPLTEQGYVTGQSWLSTDISETVPELRWPTSIGVFDRMRTEAQLTSVMRAVQLPILRTTWRLDPAGARDEVTTVVSEDLGLPIVGMTMPPRRTRDRFSWLDHLRMALLMLTYGFCAFEQVARIDSAGLARLRKLSPRLPRTVSAVHVASDGGLESIEQYDVDKPIPVSRLVVYVHDREGADWTGRSLLRPAYKNWVIKERLLRVQAQTIDRNGMGVPRYTGAEGESDLAKGIALAKAWRTGANSGAAVPYGAKLDLVGVTGTLPDADVAIRYHDEQMARAVLAHFLNLGTQTGSWALGSTFADFFTLSLQAIASQAADIANQHVVEDMVDWNFGPDEPAPRIVFDEIGSRHEATAEALKALADAGLVFPDKILEEFVRQMYGLPGKNASAPVPA